MEILNMLLTVSRTELEKFKQDFEKQKIIALTAEFRITIKKSIELLQNKIQLKTNKGRSCKYEQSILEYLQDMIDYENYQYYKDND